MTQYIYNFQQRIDRKNNKDRGKLLVVKRQTLLQSGKDNLVYNYYKFFIYFGDEINSVSCSNDFISNFLKALIFVFATVF